MRKYNLVKPRAKNEIEIKPDKDDDWFLYICYISRKTGKEVSKSMIIRKDLEQFLNSFKDKGWLDKE